MSATRTIAAFIAEADIAAFPREAVHLAKRSIMDCLGVTLAGSLESAGKIVRDCVRELGGKPLATVINGGFKTSPPLAALANGTMAHALDYDDASAAGGGHATVSILPAIFQALWRATLRRGRLCREFCNWLFRIQICLFLEEFFRKRFQSLPVKTEDHCPVFKDRDWPPHFSRFFCDQLEDFRITQGFFVKIMPRYADAILQKQLFCLLTTVSSGP